MWINKKNLATDTAISTLNSEITYREFLSQCTNYQNILKFIPQQYVYIYPKSNLEFIYIYYGLIQSNHIPVILPVDFPISDQIQIINNSSINHDAIFLEWSDFSLEQKSLNVNNISLKHINKGKDISKINKTEILFAGFTSGTTALPKGYYRSKESWVNSFQAFNEVISQDKAVHTVAFGQFSYSLNLYVLMQSIYFGQTFHLLPNFSVKQLIILLKKDNPLTVYLVPTMFHALINSLEKSETIIFHQQLKIILSGASISKKDYLKGLKYLPRAQIFQFYGTSETSFIAISEVNHFYHDGQLGKLFGNVSLSKENDSSYVTSNMLFSGYLSEPPQKIKQFELNDIIDIQDNQLYLKGRHQLIIKKGGEKISPESLEAILIKCPEIKACLIFGEKDNHYGEIICCVVVWEDKRLPLKKVNEHLAQFFSKHKTIDKVYSTHALPLNPNYKIKRNNLPEDLNWNIVETKSNELVIRTDILLDDISVNKYKKAINYTNNQIPLSYFSHLWQYFSLEAIEKFKPILINETLELINSPKVNQQYQLQLQIHEGKSKKNKNSKIIFTFTMRKNDKCYINSQYTLGFINHSFDEVLNCI